MLNFSFGLARTQIAPKHELKYLGVVLNHRLPFSPHIKYLAEKTEATQALNHRLPFSPHIKYLAEKTEATQAALTKIMPNIGGPGTRAR
ncbi:hypothetical protein QE152_g21691 [Popillia japonica]|uniref:Uncharacterized protein n=1 Tax=Popillia japonica TaxID=7064 RepID=A0AAW1KMK7_POPJA